MSRRTLTLSFLLIVLVSAVTVAQQPKKPLVNRKPPVNTAATGPSIGDGPVKSDTTHLDAIAQLEIAVKRLDNENKALKAQIDKMSSDASALRQDIDRAKQSLQTVNEGPGGVQKTFASRKQIINGEVPDDAWFRVWFSKNSGFKKPDVKIFP